MVWRGRIFGALIGLFLPVPFGWLIGMFLGWALYDKPRNQAIYNSIRAGQQFVFSKGYNEALVFGTFALLGYVARGDGSIKREQIALAENCMNMMRLNAEARTRAIAAFNRGKGNDFDLNLEINNLKQAIAGNMIVVSYVLEILVQMALVDARVETEEHRRLCEIASCFSIQESVVDRLIQSRLDQMRFQRDFYGQYQYSGGPEFHYEYRSTGNDGDGGQQSYQSAPDSGRLKEAYSLLGVAEDASWEEVRKAHKRLMLKYHPDRLKSQGIPEEMIRTYTDKAKDIQAAFDLIKRSRGEKN